MSDTRRFTPGPWALGRPCGKYDVNVVGDEGNIKVCSVRVSTLAKGPGAKHLETEPDVEGEGNARLISAAPELLILLREAWDLLGKVSPENLSADFIQRTGDVMTRILTPERAQEILEQPEAETP